MKTSKNAYYAFGLLFLLYMFDYIDRLIIVSLFPFLQKDWGLTDTECGLIIRSSNTLHPGVDPQNCIAMFEAVKAYGRYQ